MATDSTRSDGLQALTMTTSWPRPNVCLVRLTGELDIATAPLLADYLREHTAGAPAYLLLDLAAVKFLAAAGITLIVTALRSQQGIRGQVHLIGVTDNPSVRRVLDLTRLRPECVEHDSVDTALDHIDKAGRM
jgi:anti-sigma B factor antagonist